MQDKFAMIAHQCLESIDEEKLKEAGVGELVKAASTASERAGLASGIMEHYHTTMQLFIKQAGSVSSPTQSQQEQQGDTPMPLLSPPLDAH